MDHGSGSRNYELPAALSTVYIIYILFRKVSVNLKGFLVLYQTRCFKPLKVKNSSNAMLNLKSNILRIAKMLGADSSTSGHKSELHFITLREKLIFSLRVKSTLAREARRKHRALEVLLTGTRFVSHHEMLLGAKRCV